MPGTMTKKDAPRGNGGCFHHFLSDLDSRGISPKRLAASRPGIISYKLRCFVFEGEWANFRGFDMIAMAVSGYVDSEGAMNAPIMPLQVIFADCLAAYCGAERLLAGTGRARCR